MLRLYVSVKFLAAMVSYYTYKKKMSGNFSAFSDGWWSFLFYDPNAKNDTVIVATSYN